MLKYRADWQTMIYMIFTTALPLLQWRLDHFNVVLFLASLVMAFAVGAMHHNHAHLPIWRSSLLNRLTDYWFTLLQGHPGYVFFPAHLDNHHCYRNGPKDYTRTYRYRDDNNLFGFVIHPLESACTLMPLVAAHLHMLWRRRRTQFYGIVSHYFLLAICEAIVFSIDWRKALLFVAIPQLMALFFLLVSNYLQHAHADEKSHYNHSRNFIGMLNPLFFNVGYHTAHHDHCDVHWSRLPEVHESIAGRIDPRLIEKSFVWYCLRVFVLGLFIPRLRSVSLRTEKA
ncbi:MAG TPA: fatty acid desaturase [Burkholderiales bacterium]|nr:fatty acid desaturase [Burkholderiales bacterium]